MQVLSGSFTAPAPGILQLPGFAFAPKLGLLFASERRDITENTNARTAEGSFTDHFQGSDSSLSNQYGDWSRAKRATEDCCLVVMRSVGSTIQSAVKLKYLGSVQEEDDTYTLSFEVVNGDVNYSIRGVFIGD